MGNGSTLLFPRAPYTQGGSYMKITRDVSDLGIRHGRNADVPRTTGSSAKNQETIRTQMSPAQQQGGTRPAFDRAMGDALTIAQVSHSLVQKAIAISSELRAIAAEALNTGKVNRALLDNTIASVNTIITDYGKQVVAPVAADANPHLGEMPRSMGVLQDLEQNGRLIASAPAEADKNIENVRKSLDLHSLGIISHVDSLADDLQNAYGLTGGKTAGEQETKAARTSSLIAANPAGALVAQGSLNPENVGRLL